MRLRGQLVPLEVSSLLGFVPVKVGLVDGFLFLDLAKFFNFVMVDHHSLSFKVLVMEGLLGSSGGIWCLEANESKNV